MIVIGNDLVNLKNEANIRTINRPGFLKFFREDEIKDLKKENWISTLSCLWAVKESAYKCVLKLGYKVAFSPAKYKVNYQKHGSKMLGTVHYKNELFYIKCIEDGEFARAVVSNDEYCVHRIKSIHIKNTPEIYQEIESKIARFTLDESLSLKKNPNNIPVIMNSERTRRLEVSLSKEEGLYYVSVFPEWFSMESDSLLEYAAL